MAVETLPANPPTTTDANRWPRQIKYIVGNEAAERFSYYGMRGILAVYITKSLLQTDDRATTIIHVFGFVNYFMPLLGAWVSDRFWGRYRTILWISLFYCLGHGVLATNDLFHSVDAKLWCLYTGLGLIAFGSGGIKPCVSAFMGDQFRPDQGHLMRKAYGAFYFSINFGSFFSFLLIPWIASKHGYSWAFGVPGILMGVATLIFYLGTKYYVQVPPARDTRTAGFFKVFLEAFARLDPGHSGLRLAARISVLTCLVLPVIAMVCMVFVGLHSEATSVVKGVGWTAVVVVVLWNLLVLGASITNVAELPTRFWDGARSRFSELEIAAARSVAPIIAVFAFIPVFWTLFEQSSSTWVLQGGQMQPFNLFGFKIEASQMQSLNPALVMVMVPVLTWGLYPLLERLGWRVTSLRRISLGLVFTSVSYVVVAWLQKRLENHEALSLAWQAVPYILLTSGEVLVSTTGLEFAFTQAAPSMKSTIMSFWYLTVAIGNLFVSTITQIGGGHGDASVSSGRFLLYAVLTLIVAVLFIVVAMRYQYRHTQEVT